MTVSEKQLKANKSRNETRHGMFAAYGAVLKADRQIQEHYRSTNRWTWRGRPTRKVRRLKIVEQRMSGSIDVCEALLM